jgi:hypothetical protein
MMPVQTEYKYLEPRPGSNYRQLFLKLEDRRKIRAEIIYRMTVGPEPRTPEEVAEDYRVPVEAVREAIHYCVNNEELLREERDRETARIRALGLDRPPYAPEPGPGT